MDPGVPTSQDWHDELPSGLSKEEGMLSGFHKSPTVDTSDSRWTRFHDPWLNILAFSVDDDI